MGDLHRRCHARNDDDLVAPVELLCLVGAKLSGTNAAAVTADRSRYHTPA